MSSAKNEVTGRWELLGDGFGSSRVVFPMLPAPNGANQATYFIRAWFDDITADLLNTPVLWGPQQCFGLKFDSSYPENAIYNDSEWNNFLGLAGLDSSGAADKCFVNFVSGEDHCGYGDTGGTDCNAFILNGRGGAMWQAGSSVVDPTHSYRGAHTLPKNSTIGLATTLIWQVTSSVLNEAVYFSSWINTDSLNLASINLKNVSPDNVAATFPISNYSGGSSLYDQTVGSTAVINGTSQTGTNWRPSSGVMAFPTHFMAIWPFTTKGLIIDRIGVQYARLTV